jgi:type VI secretion system protein ImpJ
MKFLSRVVWSEGMYLGPHHFQTQSRYFEDSVGFLVSSLWHEPWGLLHGEFDPEAIRNGSVVLLHASGVFPDGLAFECPASDPAPPARNIVDVFPATDPALMLYLGVPSRKDNGLDCDLNGGQSNIRYRVMHRSLRDETNGMDEREVDLAQKNLQLFTESEISRDTTSIPVARILRDGHGQFIFDPDFLPACMRISASEQLMLLVKRLLETVHEKSTTIARSARNKGKFEAGTSALDVANYWFLHALHSTYPTLRHLYATKHAHPEELFQELSRLAGALCTFAVDSDPADLPAYNHRDPGPVFRALDQHIRRHLEIVVPSNVVTLKFGPSKAYISEADVPDERCLRRCRWILGIRSSLGEAELIRSVPRLVKVCSARFVPELVKRALPGMTITHLPVPPSSIRAEADMQYFVVETTGPCWEHILQTRQVGVYIPGDISNPEFDLTIIVEAAS